MKKLFLFFVLFGVILDSTAKAQAKAQAHVQTQDDLMLIRIYDEGLSQGGYILIDQQSKEAVVIDPRKDISVFLDSLEAHDANLVYVTETHIHADYLSGARELAAVSGATLALSAEGPEEWRYKFHHKPLRAGDMLQFGAYSLQVLHTPGHTPESISFLLVKNSNLLRPLKAFTGDFLFVGDVGRPDLLEKYAEDAELSTISARQLYKSLEQFVQLPGHMEIWPGHGAGSFCGKSLSNIPFSTLEEQVSSNPALQYLGNEDAFVEYVLADQVVPPAYFKLMKAWNRDGSSLKFADDRYAQIDANELEGLIAKGVLIVDTRSRAEIAKGFIPGTLHIELNNSFNNWFAQLVSHDRQVAFIVAEGQEELLTQKLMRVGFENVLGVVDDISSVARQQIAYVSAADMEVAIQQGSALVLDIRTEREYAGGHIEGVERLTLTDIRREAAKMDKNKPLIIHCQSGARAAIGFSLFEQLGFKDIRVYNGGINEWKALGKELVSK